MRTICLVTSVILAMPLLAHSQEKVPKATLLHYSNPALYFEYAPGIVNVTDLQAGMFGKMPSDCTYRFAGVDWQRYVRVVAECPEAPERRFYFESPDAMKRLANCKSGDEVVFDGWFRVIEDKRIDKDRDLVFVVQGIDNKSIATPKVAPDAGQGNGQKMRLQPENLLEKFRRRQQLRELYLTGRVLLVIGQAGVVHRFAPEKARQLILDERQRIRDDPDLGSSTRAALALMLLDLKAVHLDDLFGRQ